MFSLNRLLGFKGKCVLGLGVESLGFQKPNYQIIASYEAHNPFKICCGGWYKVTLVIVLTLRLKLNKKPNNSCGPRILPGSETTSEIGLVIIPIFLYFD